MRKLNIKEIITAWASKISPSSELKELAEKRLDICNSCEFREYNKVGKFYKCGKCGCPLAGKSFSHEEHACPEGKWVIVENEYIKKVVNNKKKSLI